MNSEVNGVVVHHHITRKTDYLFRISMKSIIRNEAGEVLVVRESGRTWWDLPGGGMDHDESIKEAIGRELYEEVSLRGEFTYRILAVEEPHFLEHSKLWQIRLIFEVNPVDMTFEVGEDGDEIAFLDPFELGDSENIAERKVYEYSMLSEPQWQ